MPGTFQPQPMSQRQGVLYLLADFQRVAQHATDGEPFAAEIKFAGAEQQNDHGNAQQHRDQLALGRKRQESHHQKNYRDGVNRQDGLSARKSHLQQPVMNVSSIRAKDRQSAQSAPQNSQQQ